MEPSPGLIRFSEVVARDDFPLDHAALLIGAWDYPQRDLDALPRDARRDRRDASRPMSRARSNGIGRARAISDYLFDRLGFSGNTDDYYDPRNSFLCRRDRSPHRHPDLAVGPLPRGRAPRRRARAGRELPRSLPRARRDRRRVAVPRSVHARPRADAGRSRSAAAQDHHARRRARAERDRGREQASDRRAHARQPRRHLRPQRRSAALARRARAARVLEPSESAHRARSRAASRARRRV